MGNKEDIDGILLHWTTFDERTKTNQNKGKINKQLRPERTKTIKVRSKAGGWSKTAEEVEHKYFTDLEQSLRERSNGL